MSAIMPPPQRDSAGVVARSDRSLGLIVKPVLACNSGCVYCCAEREASACMSARTLDSIFDRVIEYGPAHVTYLWHGGEPLLAGADFYRRVLDHCGELDRRYGIRSAHLMQTNLLLITPEILEVLLQLAGGVALSSSVDPIPGARLLADGRSEALHVWLDRLFQVQAAGLGVNVVYVVHGRALGRARSLYHYLANLGIRGARFNPVYLSAHRSVPEELRLSPEQFGDFLFELRQVWDADGRRLRVEPLAEWEDAVNGDPGWRPCCAHSDDCGSGQIAIGPQGEVHNCGRLSDRGALSFGNIGTHSLAELEGAQRSAGLVVRRARLAEGTCRGCPWLGLCRGGCPDDGEGGDPMARTIWCRGYRRYFERAYPDGFPEPKDGCGSGSTLPAGSR